MFDKKNLYFSKNILVALIIFPVSVHIFAEENNQSVAMQVNSPQENIDSGKLDIYEYRVVGNSVLSNAVIEQAIYPYLGQDRLPEDVDIAREALEKVYQDLGYKTVQVLIPQQTVRDGVVNLEVVERRIGQLSVKGAKYSSVERIKNQAPSFVEGNVPNFNEVNKDLIALNNSMDRRVSPAINEGKEPNTLDVDLVVDDDLPLHGSIELNNRQSAGTKRLRTALNLSYNDLWQRGHTLSLGYLAAPERLDDSQVVYGSYIAPIQGTRYSVIFNAIRSDSDVAPIGGGGGLGNSIGRGKILGIRGVASLRSTESFNDSLSFGVERKDFKQQVGKGALGLNMPVTYYPFSTNYNATWRNDKSLTQAEIGLVFASRALGSDDKDFRNARSEASTQQFSVSSGLSNTYDFKSGMQLLSRIKGQITDRPLLAYEQFSIGGVDTVRGYYESESTGDYGFAGGLDLKSPMLFKQFFKNSFVDELRLYVFTDVASVKTKNALPGVASSETLASTGLGLNFNVLDYVNGSVEWARPLKEGQNTREGDDRVLFQIKSSF